MPTALLAALLLSAAPFPAPAAADAAAPELPAPAGAEQAAPAPPAARSTPASATPAPIARALDLPGTPALGRSLAAPGLLLAALAAAALLLARRRRAAPRRVEVLETTSLGPRRALVLARVGDEVLLLGSSEAGLALLRALPAVPAVPAAAPASPPPLPARAAPPDLLARLRGLGRSAAPAPAPGFEALLAESAEDQELRRKLARGQAGSVR